VRDCGGDVIEGLAGLRLDATGNDLAVLTEADLTRDKDEVARRSTPAPPISTIPPLPSETPNQREDRLRLQKLYDDHRRKRESKFEDYEELFALDYGKAIAIHYHFLSPTLQLDLDRAIEEIDPPTTNVTIHYRVLKTHLASKTATKRPANWHSSVLMNEAPMFTSQPYSPSSTY
jgi:hypothetical protein